MNSKKNSSKRQRRLEENDSKTIEPIPVLENELMWIYRVLDETEESNKAPRTDEESKKTK